jgi:hypothetical protein
MTKEELKTCYEIQEKIKEESIKVLKWYYDNIGDGLWGIDHLEFDCIEDNIIYYEGWDNSDLDKFNLSEDFLIMDGKELEEYKVEYFKAKKIKEDLAKKIKIKEKRKDEEEYEAGMYKLYLELKDKYEGDK